MSQELHYTSVPRGLKPGSRGFCTVASTPNMPVTLTERLESLSAYQPVFPPGDPSESKNPIVFAHFRLTINQRALSILSRIGPAGLDYSGRPNKFAHHLVLDPNERPQAGPAWLLAFPDLMQTQWTGDPRELPAGRQVPSGDSAARIAQAWRNVTGDAGWAGVLAEAFLEDPKRPAYLLFQPGMNVLPLFTEALALLPPARRWDVDFTTYLTQLPQGITCAWRGVVDGSPEALHARRLPNALIIDLGHPLGPAKGGPLVHLARTGERIELLPPKPLAGPTPSSPDTLPAGRSATPKPTASPEPDFALIPELAARVKPRRHSKTRDDSGARTSKPQISVAIWASAVASLVALIATIAFFAVKFSAREDVEVKQALVEREKRIADAAKDKAEQERADIRKKAEEDLRIAKIAPSQPPIIQAPRQKAPDSASDKQKEAAPLAADPPPKKLTSIPVIVPDVFELDEPLSGLRDFTQKALIIKPEDPPIAELRLLGIGTDLSCDTTKSISGQRITVSSTPSGAAPEELATFELTDGRKVEFHWNRNVTPLTKKEERRALKDCVLEAKLNPTTAHYYLLRKKPDKPKTRHEHEKRIERTQEQSGNWSWRYVWDPDPQLFADSTFRWKNISIENLKLPLIDAKDVVFERGDGGEVWTGKWQNHVLVKFARIRGAIHAELTDNQPSSLNTRIEESNRLLFKKKNTLSIEIKAEEPRKEVIKELHSEIEKLHTHIARLKRTLLIYQSDPEASIAFECEGLKFEIAKIVPQPMQRLK